MPAHCQGINVQRARQLLSNFNTNESFSKKSSTTDSEDDFLFSKEGLACLKAVLQPSEYASLLEVRDKRRAHGHASESAKSKQANQAAFDQWQAYAEAEEDDSDRFYDAEEQERDAKFTRDLRGMIKRVEQQYAKEHPKEWKQLKQENGWYDDGKPEEEEYLNAFAWNDEMSEDHLESLTQTAQGYRQQQQQQQNKNVTVGQGEEKEPSRFIIPPRAKKQAIKEEEEQEQEQEEERLDL